MFAAAVAHIYSFPHYPFHINSPQYWNNPNHNWFRAILSMMDISDIQEDVSEHFGVVSNSVTRHFRGRSMYQPLSRGPRFGQHDSKYIIGKRNDGDDDLISSYGPGTSSSGSMAASAVLSPELGAMQSGRRLDKLPEHCRLSNYGSTNNNRKDTLTAIDDLSSEPFNYTCNSNMLPSSGTRQIVARPMSPVLNSQQKTALDVDTPIVTNSSGNLIDEIDGFGVKAIGAENLGVISGFSPSSHSLYRRENTNISRDYGARISSDGNSILQSRNVFSGTSNLAGNDNEESKNEILNSQRSPR